MNETQEERRRAAFAGTMGALRMAENALPDFTSDYDDEIARLYERIVNRPAFRYDPLGDPLYRNYRDEMLTQGGRAMRDSAGQAAGLTGGYGSSYAESVGQQQYGLYLEKLGQAMPELYKAAYERYRDEEDALYRNLNAARTLAELQYDRGKDRFDRAAALENMQYERGEKSWERLVSLITQAGYRPEDEELEKVGLTRAQADALREQFLRRNPAARTAAGGGGYTGSAGSGAGSASAAGEKEKTKLDANRPGAANNGKKRRV